MSPAELRIPKHRGEIVASLVGAAILTATVAVAASNLLQRIALLPSAVWLLLVCMVLSGLLYEFGFRTAAINVLGGLTTDHFVACVDSGAQPPVVHFGFRFLGYPFYYLTIAVADVMEVYWNTGQASYHAKRDLNDWHVVLCYEHHDPEKTAKERAFEEKCPRARRTASQDLYLVGSSGPKTVTAAFGLALVEFLRQAGVNLVPGEDDCHFERRSIEDAGLRTQDPAPPALGGEETGH